MKELGILGGMGPAATADLFTKIIELTDAKSDQEHIHIYIDNNTNIPDRTTAILNGSDAPLKEMILSARKLEAMGADVIIMPCNTAHYFIDAIQSEIKIPMINMIKVTAKRIATSESKKPAILATTGTCQMEIYDKALKNENIDFIKLNQEELDVIMDLIYKGIKLGDDDYDAKPFMQVLESLINQGADSFILGCTELPLAFSKYSIDLVPIFDATTILAQEAIKFVGASVKK